MRDIYKWNGWWQIGFENTTCLCIVIRGWISTRNDHSVWPTVGRYSEDDLFEVARSWGGDAWRGEWDARGCVLASNLLVAVRWLAVVRQVVLAGCRVGAEEVRDDGRLRLVAVRLARRHTVEESHAVRVRPQPHHCRTHCVSASPPNVCVGLDIGADSSVTYRLRRKNVL